MLGHYTVAPEYKNLIHYLSKEDRPENLNICLAKDSARYLAVTDSPLKNATSSCGDALFCHITDTESGISTRLHDEELFNIFDFPEMTSKAYFNKLT
jgi:hypothetical protein